MLGQPEAVVAQRLDMARQVQAVGQRGSHVAALADRGEIQDRQRNR
jgi:hypothetical protein